MAGLISMGMRHVVGCLLIAACAREPMMNEANSSIRETIERYHDGVNHRRPAAIAALFAAGGVWEIAPPFEHRFVGRTAIEEGISGTIGATEVLVQTCAPIVVDVVDASHATARTSMQEFGRFRDGRSMHVAGTYFDELEKEADGVWRFTRRRFVASYADELPVPGKALSPSPSWK